MKDNSKKGRPFLTIFLAVAVLFGLSMLPWGEWTGHNLKDFNLLSDLFPTQADSVVSSNEIIDPELEKEMSRLEELETSQTIKLADTTAIPAKPAELVSVPASEPRVEGEMIIEDYTLDGSGLRHLKNALAQRDSRPVRIAVIGDSYIEGDILTQDIRSMLQEQYGGRGVGYMPAHSEVEGFRRTIVHSDNGWTHHDIRRTPEAMSTIAGEYFSGNSGASVSYKGVKRDQKLAAWNTSTLLFIAPAAGKITLTTDAETREYPVTASDDVQSIILSGETSSLKISSTVPGLKMLGTWLNDASGVTVDCMSVRGYSGVSHRKISTELAHAMGQTIDYDLIVLEYGINALSAQQSDYSAYGKLMAAAVERLRECYPNADILLLGIGDRGQKINGEVHSLPTAPNMVAAQRKVAQNAGCLFWDTREAMGGEDAIVEWRENKLVNADYIHLNSQGGRKLAQEFVKSLKRKLSE